MSQLSKVNMLSVPALMLALALALHASAPAVAGDEHSHAQGEHAGRGEARVEGRGHDEGRAHDMGRAHEDGRGIPRGMESRREVDGRGHVLDERYNHGRYYPRPGSVVSTLPEGYRPYYHDHDRYYFSGGIWYAPRGPGFAVIAPPFGLVIGALPFYYSTVWFGGIPYYYANNVYYTWQPEQNGYVVAEPPTDAGQPASPPIAAQEDLIIYPKNGQSQELQAADRFECHSWARSQTGFDPTQPGGGAQGDGERGRSNYNRAMAACLQARGYEVK
jgi:hypothetical protein